MASDYRILVKAEPAKQAAQTRQKAIQASKKAIEQKKTGTERGVASPAMNKELVSSMKSLIASNKSLEKAIIQMSKTGKPGGIPQGGGSPLGSGEGAGGGLGAVGSSMMIGGTIVAATGFAIQKINQVGNAYIQLAGEQAKSVGFGGFQSGAGMYGATEMGGGIAAYAKARGGAMGKVQGLKNKKRITDIGALYGMGAEEVFGQAGTFQRAGGSLTQSAAIAAGGGIGTEMPVLLQGMAGILEDAIKEGFDTSDMSKSLSQNLTALTQQTKNRNVQTALAMAQSFKSVQSGVAGGKMGSMEAMYAAQTSRESLTSKLNAPGGGYADELVQAGIISEAQAGKIKKMKGGTYQELTSELGAAATQEMMRYETEKADPIEMQKRMMTNIKKQYGSGVEGRQLFSQVAAQQGWSLDRSKLQAMWELEGEKAPDMKKQIGKGEKTIREGAQAVIESDAGKAVYQKKMREEMVMGFGPGYSQASLALEKGMLDLVKAIAPSSETIAGFATGIKEASEAVSNFKSNLKKDIDLKIETYRTGASVINKFWTGQ